MDRILVTGASGQIGTELVPILRKRYGADNVIATDLRQPSLNGSSGIFESLDVCDAAGVESIVSKYDITTIYHLASLLSARGEMTPDLAWTVNMDGLRCVLELARRRGIRLFWPSSIAVFGPTTPRHSTPQHTPLEPTTIYGITKRSGELLCLYYHEKYGVDVRSLRYPGIISHTTRPGGGTTDYAVEVFHAAVAEEPYTCFVRPDTRLPMMYMDDAVKATLDIMTAEAERLSVWTSYNVAAISFSVEELVDEIRRHVPHLEVTYEPDHRQRIAASWPEDIDDSVARADWNWRHEFDLARLVNEMLTQLQRTAGKTADERSSNS